MGTTSILLLIIVLTTSSSIGHSGSQTLPRKVVIWFEADPVMRNCLDIQRHFENSTDGLYTIFPFDCCPERPIQVYCDMTTNGGGWTVIQRRNDIQPREEFYRTWMEYALGFGNLKGEFWLGLDVIHALTNQAFNEIRFDLMDFDDVSRWAQYGFFYVHDRENNFKMEVNTYTGDAGDSFAKYHNGCSFTTKDKDLDLHESLNCAEEYHGAWWYYHCHRSNLNGFPYEGVQESYGDGIEWSSWHGQHYSLKKTEMKIRPTYLY